MKNSLLLSTGLIAFCLHSCNTSGTNNTDTSSTTSTSEEGAKSNNFWQKMIMHEIKDNRGMISALMPLPESWKIHMANSDGISLSGPNNIVVKDFAPKNFMMNYDQNLQYVYEQSGQPMRSMPPIDQLIQEDIIPFISNKGMEYVKHYELPQVSKMDKWYSDQLYKAFPAQSFVKAYGIDVKKQNGDPAFLIVHLNSSRTQQMETWYYLASLLEADADVFEKAKKQFVFALENMRYNLEPIMAYNKEEAQRIGKSWKDFNARMAANQAAFEAQQIAHINKSNAINDAIMSNWKQSNAASDKRQEQFVDYIYENEKVQNTETGQTYKVQQGSNQYWMNNNGEYIGTKSNTYNPNLDENMNEQKWQELKKVDE